jgi:hypothetical protein
MSVNFARTDQTAHLPSSEKGARTAKPHLPKAEKNAVWVKHGAAMKEVQHTLQMTLEELAYALKKDVRQVGRWMEGTERPQIELMLANERFEGAMVIAIARRTTGVDVDTVVHIRRSAK